MNEQQNETLQKESRGNNTLIGFGAIFFLFACLALVGAVTLDLVGEKTVGKVSNASTNCPAGKTCWTGQVDFTTKEGEQVSFYPLTFPMLFDLDPFLSGRSYEDYGEYQVRYLEAFPAIAKVKMAFFLEYSTHLSGLCLGVFLLLIGSAFSSSGKSSKPHKPIVIDLSNSRKK